MIKTHIDGFEMEDGIEMLFKKNGLVQTPQMENADVVLYKGSFEDLLRKNSGKIKAQTIIPYSMFLMNQGAGPINLSDQLSLGRVEFDQEDIRGVSDKINSLMDSLQSEEHFSDLARYMKLNAIELAQNALIHKRLTGKAGVIKLEVLETSMFYNICVTDPFGALSADEILSKLSRVSLEKTYEEKESGAGLGLFMVLNASDCVIFSLKSQKQTQVCCIINKYKRLKQFKNKSPALFIFSEDGSERGQK